MFNPELMSMARAGAREHAIAVALQKMAVIPGGQPDPAAAAGGAPPPGMDPAAGGMPPGMDPAAAGGAPPGAPPPTDPALAQAGGGMQDMVNQAVQAAMAAQGGGAPGAPGAAGKTAKPDVAVELQKSNQMIYKLGIMLQALCKEAGLEFPPAVMFGPPPDQSDPALAAIATTPPQQLPGGGPGGAQGQPPPGDPAAAGGAQPPFPPIQGLSGNVADGGASEKAGSVLDDDNPLTHAAYGLDEILKAASAVRASLDLDPVDAMGELLSGMHVEKVAMPPQLVGAVFAEEATGPLSAQPMALARRMRERAGAR